jgi:hypothetical protein
MHTATRVTELRTRRGEAVGQFGTANKCPVVIFPGLCSTGLKVSKSTEKPEWANERIWLAIERLMAHGSQSGVVPLAGAAAMVGLGNKFAGGVGSLARTGSAVVGGIADRTVQRGQARRRQELLALSDGSALVVHLHQARSLPAADSSGSADPFARVSLLDEQGGALGEEVVSNVAKQTLKPYWDEDLVIGMECNLAHATTLQLVIYDHDTLGANDLIGMIRVPIPSDKLDGSGSDAIPRQWLALTDPTAKLVAPFPAGGGQVELWVTFRPAAENQQDESAVSKCVVYIQAHFRGWRVRHLRGASTAYLSRAGKKLGGEWLRHMALESDLISDPPGKPSASQPPPHPSVRTKQCAGLDGARAR